MTARQQLAAALAAYDGRHVDVLEELRDELRPDAAMLRAAVSLSCDDDVRVAQGASWLLQAWLERGARATPKLVAVLVAALPGVRDKWVRQHLSRCLPLVPLAEASVEAARDFLVHGCRHEQPFVRAWSIDSLHRLAHAHPGCAEPARRALEAGQHDAAASVRARVRNIQRGR